METFICGFMNAFSNILLMLIILLPDGGTVMVVQWSVLLVLVSNGLVRWGLPVFSLHVLPVPLHAPSLLSGFPSTFFYVRLTGESILATYMFSLITYYNLYEITLKLPYRFVDATLNYYLRLFRWFLFFAKEFINSFLTHLTHFKLLSWDIKSTFIWTFLTSFNSFYSIFI